VTQSRETGAINRAPTVRIRKTGGNTSRPYE
jgi:hypothetical protein